ncbi:adenylate/guanylate cyclase domain-containing protein, partial [Desulfovibrio sp. OttesenSCG-928-F20]|nr:adenylate/guanylate cyclase domain-containing protein [Desulfovibrio sp. OttesenSCG-928-F20]
ARYGQWPWPRYLMAALAARLVERGAAAVAFDVLLAEADRSSPVRMREYLKRDLDLGIGFTGLPPELEDYDSLLADSIEGMPVVLGSYVRFSGSLSEELHFPKSLQYAVLASSDAVDVLSGLHSAVDATFPLPLFSASAPVGMVNMSPDMDGIVRQVPLLLRLGDKLYPGLSLRALMTAMGRNSVVLGADADGLAFVKVGPYEIPVSPQGTALVPFTGPRKTYPYYPAVDVLEGRVGEGELEGRVVFVGTSAPGLMDIRATPFDRVYPGVEVHASMLDAMLSKRHIVQPPWSPGLQVLAIVCCGLVCTVAFGLAGPRIYLPVAALLLGLCVFASRELFREGLFVSPVYALLTIASLGAALLCVRFIHEEQQKRLLRGTFSRYVAPEVVNRITRLSGDIFAGEERELSIMFTDIRGFTSISEKLGPQQIVDLLNRYFTPMTALVRGNKGTLDKFIGDALMAFWNAPLDVPGHPALAVRTALDMQKEVARLNGELKEDFGLSIAMGVGLHTGRAYVGNMGSQELINYTLIGDAVNLASRLEGLCPKYGVGLVVSEDVKNACGESFAFQPLDTIRVKGKARPVAVFTALEHSESEVREDELRQWQGILEAYKNGDFALALASLETLMQKQGEAVLYSVFAERCRILAATPPENWDGIWTLASK